MTKFLGKAEVGERLRRMHVEVEWRKEGKEGLLRRQDKVEEPMQTVALNRLHEEATGLKK